MKIAIHIEDTHSCGQVHEQIVHVDECHFKVMQAWPRFADLLEKYEQAMFVPQSEFEGSKREIEFTGVYSKVELKGIEHKDNRLVCMGCGANVLFPEGPGE